MIDVTVKITAIIMYCDESILNLELGNGYTIEKCYYDDSHSNQKLKMEKINYVLSI